MPHMSSKPELRALQLQQEERRITVGKPLGEVKEQVGNWKREVSWTPKKDPPVACMETSLRSSNAKVGFSNHEGRRCR